MNILLYLIFLANQTRSKRYVTGTIQLIDNDQTRHGHLVLFYVLEIDQDWFYIKVNQTYVLDLRVVFKDVK
jgi:hypothetical protein